MRPTGAVCSEGPGPGKDAEQGQGVGGGSGWDSRVLCEVQGAQGTGAENQALRGPRDAQH